MSHKSLVSLAAVGAVVVLLLVGGLACSKSSSTGDLTITSSVNSNHSHQVTISNADIENPPATDKTIDTTYTSGHRHTITLTSQDYQSIEDGNEVTVTSSSSGHTHTFNIKK